MTIRACPLLALTTLAVAAEGGQSPAPAWHASGYLSGHHVGAADFSEQPGRLTVDELLGEGRVLFKPFTGTFIGGGIGGGQVSYRSDLLDQRYGIDDPMSVGWGRAMAIQFLSERWGLLAQGALLTGADGHAAWKEGLQYQIMVGPVYATGDGFLLMAGAYIASRIGLPATVQPIVSLDWRMTPEWRLRIFDPVDNLSRLTWAPSPRFEVGARVDVRIMEFALAHTADWGQAAVLRDRRVLVAAECTWRPLADDRLQIRPFAGVSLGRAMQVRDRSGNTLFDDHINHAPDLGVTLRSDF